MLLSSLTTQTVFHHPYLDNSDLIHDQRGINNNMELSMISKQRTAATATDLPATPHGHPVLEAQYTKKTNPKDLTHSCPAD